SVVKAARLLHEDGAVARAIELLRLAIEDRPAEARPWLALFEIFRLERAAPEFAELARHFRTRHGAGPTWSQVQRVGREIEPGNELYRPGPVDGLRTIGPHEGRSRAGPAAAADFEPQAENWLEAPMDFDDRILAVELRRRLLAERGLGERDLDPDPAAVLRSVEKLTVA
ncbi:MAG TPA: hypothetical protein VLC53_18010, partial [Myxococcota bacterium]|nr:hypothetical protein [Myxococcota bacterium]